MTIRVCGRKNEALHFECFKETPPSAKMLFELQIYLSMAFSNGKSTFVKIYLLLVTLSMFSRVKPDPF